jgi:hypothetical protein
MISSANVMNFLLQQSHLYTHAAYSSALAEALGADCEVVDIYVVPDYTKIFENCIDEKFSRVTLYNINLFSLLFRSMRSSSL